MWKLTDKQRIFVAEYAKCRNATLAAIAAGYDKKNARSTGSKLLAKPWIRAAVDEMLENVTHLAEVEMVDVLKGLKYLAEREEATDASRVSAWGRIAKIISSLGESRGERSVTYFVCPKLPEPSEESKWEKLREMGVDVDMILDSGVLYDWPDKEEVFGGSPDFEPYDEEE
jgi:hypothetical protein